MGELTNELHAYQDAVCNLKERIAQLESQLPEGMKHCTITCHQCAKGHTWLSATNWIGHGCIMCELEQAKSQSFDAYIDREFKKNLELAREEMLLDENDNNVEDIETQAWRFAKEWTEEDIASEVAKRIDRKQAAKQEAINQAFYK